MEATGGGSPPQSPPRPPQIGEGQDVLARWTDGLLYLGIVKKVDAARRGCLIQFEDNSQFFVLWKDISPAAEPGDDPSCCVCAGNSRNPENSLVRCGKCGHAYHQRCHVPPPPGGAAPWSCRRCVFAVATKRGGALRRGPQARAMLRMKSVLPYALGALDWDPPHLHNLQHCYCYCGGPGHWNLKMLQCRRCRQWFHEACTQCLRRPLLYGDRFYIFECSVCRGGAESVRRLPLRWVDVAHLLLYHLSVRCRRKYFDLEREILPFANANWDALLLGQLAATPRSERYGRLLGALSTHKDRIPLSPQFRRFVSGREMKKRKGLFGLHSRAPPPLPPELLRGRPSPTPHRDPAPSPGPSLSPERGKGGARRRRPPQRSQDSPGGSYNFRRSGARGAPSPPIRMFASFHPSNKPSSPTPDPDPAPSPPRRRPLPDPAVAPPPDPDRPNSAPPPGQAPPPRVLARRVTLDGTVQYLLEWAGPRSDHAHCLLECGGGTL
ncbi:PHD finger protein 1 isoform X15 [Vidua chalybeata]|uniref:PHD finger protein 1 isoform X15 n=1 Tax=Vidua chalybeata TaxID=81927 RepID=UPI0023A87BFB|nr:PHD finger protein 1 isoform X15 [Vidua chalybeata]